MTLGIPQDMRRMAFFSLSGHLIILVLLTAVPLLKMPAREASSYNVMLISQPAPSPREARTAPVSPVAKQPVKAPPPPPIAKAPASVTPPPAKPVASPAQPPIVFPNTRERLTDSLKDVQNIALPKEVASAAAPVDPLRPLRPLSEYQPPTSVTPKPDRTTPKTPDRHILDALQKADESLKKPPAEAPRLPVAVTPRPTPSPDAEISKMLNQLHTAPTPRPMEPEPVVSSAPKLSDELKQMFAGVPKQPSAASSLTRSATLEKCPPKARSYCPLLEAAINRMWNEDTNPTIRQVLENAGDAVVLVHILITPNGDVRDISIQEPSGNASYDRAVQSLLRGLRVPRLPEEMKGERFEAITSFRYTRPSPS